MLGLAGWFRVGWRRGQRRRNDKSARHARANSFGVISGAILGVAATFYTVYGTHVHWLWYAVVGPVVGLVFGYLLSFLRPPPAEKKIDA